MKYKNLIFWVLFLFLGISATFGIPVDTLRKDTLKFTRNTDTKAYSVPDYNLFINKADRAFRLGFYKRAERLYGEAAKVNPASEYVQSRLFFLRTRSHHLQDYFYSFNFDKPDLLIRSLIYLIVTFIVLMFLVLLITLIHRGRRESREKQKQVLAQKYQNLLVDYLFSSNDQTLSSEISQVAATPFNRNILINQIIDLSINLSGNAKDKLRHLFLSLKLDSDSRQKLYNPFWHIKVKGLRELALMDITSENEEIIRNLENKNNILRMEARLALVKLNHLSPFIFLDHLERPFTLWEQLTVYETILFHNLPIPAFDRWLFSKNKTVALFALRMINLFKQTETYPGVLGLLEADDPEIRKMAIYTLGNLRIRAALPQLKRLYKNENYENCLEILKALARIPDEMMLHFLLLVIDKEEDVQLQIAAAMAIVNLGEQGKSALQKLMDSDYKNYQIIIRHVLDKRIS